MAMNNNQIAFTLILLMLFLLSCNRKLNSFLDIKPNTSIITPVYIDEDSTVHYNTNKKPLNKEWK